MSISDEKPWILYFNYKSDPLQIDQDEYEALMADLKEEKSGAILKNGTYVSLKFVDIVANPHYVSPESIARTRKKRALWNEYQALKKQGVLTSPEDYIEWKKENVKKMKEFHKYMEVEENEKKRTA